MVTVAMVGYPGLADDAGLSEIKVPGSYSSMLSMAGWALSRIA